METDKVKYLINMINDMELTNKLRLVICMSDSNCTNLKCINILIIHQKRLMKNIELRLKLWK